MPMRHMVDVVVGDRVNRQTGVTQCWAYPWAGCPGEGRQWGGAAWASAAYDCDPVDGRIEYRHITHTHTHMHALIHN